MIPQPKTFMLDSSDLDRSLSNPALSMLAAAGWTVAAAQSVRMPNGQVSIALVLWPPAASRSPLLGLGIGLASFAVGLVTAALLF